MIKIISKVIASLFVCASSIGLSFAQESLSSQIYLKMPNVKTIDSITLSPIEGFFIVKANDKLTFIIDKYAKYVFYGSVVDITNGKVLLRGTNLDVIDLKDHQNLDFKN